MLGQANLWLHELHTRMQQHRPPFDSPQRQRHGLLLLWIGLWKGGEPVGARGCNVLTRAHLPWAEPEAGNGGVAGSSHHRSVSSQWHPQCVDRPQPCYIMMWTCRPTASKAVNQYTTAAHT